MPGRIPAPSDNPTLSQEEAARFAGVSAKTLERLAVAGEPVGRFKLGRRVLFSRAQLATYLATKLNPVAQPTPTTR